LVLIFCYRVSTHWLWCPILCSTPDP